jgi:hypothetical protein
MAERAGFEPAAHLSPDYRYHVIGGTGQLPQRFATEGANVNWRRRLECVGHASGVGFIVLAAAGASRSVVAAGGRPVTEAAATG